MHNKDAVDLLWEKLNNAELAMFVYSIKVDYRRNHQKYTNILQEIYIQIPTEKTPLLTTAGVSELKTRLNNNCNTSDCPAEGAYLPDDMLYTESYSYKQWVISAVTPHHNKIRESREEGQGEQKLNNYMKGRQQKWKVCQNPLPNIETGSNQATID